MNGSDLTAVAALLVGGKLAVAGSDLIWAAVVVGGRARVLLDGCG